MPRTLFLPFTLAAVFLSIPVSLVAQEKEVNEVQIDSMLHKLTLEQKIDLIGGVSTWYAHAEPSIGLPALRLSDGPAGLRSGIPAIAYPAPVALAATWDTALAQRVGTAVGHDARARGIDFLLGPGVNIARAPMGGRNFEYMGEDPWLASRIAVAYIRGVQSQGVSATVKHFLLNNQEFDRHNASSDADERAKREIYLPAFEAAVKEAHVGAMMDSYNLVDGVHATENGWINKELAKREWGFDGIIMSDWDSVYDGLAAAQNGLDLEMPFSRFMSQSTLLPAIRNGQISAEVIDDKVRRILRIAVRFGMLQRDMDYSQSLLPESGREVALQVARESIVLLKNRDDLLPLAPAKTCVLAVVGPNASPAVVGGGGSAVVDSYESISELQGIVNVLRAQPSTPGCRHTVLYDSGFPSNYEVFSQSHFFGDLLQQAFSTRDWTGPSADLRREHLNEDRIVTSKSGSLRWSGIFKAPHAGHYFVIVHDGRPADKHVVFVNDQPLATHSTDLHGERFYLPLPSALKEGEIIRLRFDYLPGDNVVYPGFGILAEDEILSPRAKFIVRKADAVVVAAGFDKSTEHEGSDRTFALPPLQDTLIRQVSSINPRTIVTLNARGNVDMNAWIENVPALLHLWYGGQETGTVTADVLFGLQDPEGHLPVSFEQRWEDNPTHDSYYSQPDERGIRHIRYKEGIFLGYRFYSTPSVNRRNVQPRFPFGFGLSYTRFSFSNLRVTQDANDHQVLVTLTVTNTGPRDGGTVAQIYVGPDAPHVPRPAIELKGFEKIHLHPGESRSIRLTLNERSFSYWSVEKHRWRADDGTYVISAGDSSIHLPQWQPITLHFMH